MNKALLVLLACAFFAGGGGEAATKQPSLWRTKKNLAETKEKEKKLLERKKLKAREEQRTLAELERLDKKEAVLREDLRKLEDEVRHTDARLEAMRKQRSLTTQEMEEARERLREFLRAWRQECRGTSQADMAIWCASLEAGRLSNARLDRYNLRQREKMLKEYRSQRDAQRLHMARKKREVEAVRRQRADFLGRIRRDRKRTEDLLAETRASKRAFENLIVRIQERQKRDARAKAMAAASVPSSSFLRQLAWPVSGRIIRGYGKHKHEEFNAVVTSSGIEIAARRGTPVKAAASGRVVHRDWLKGYGRVMIVDHGSGLYTVYGHLQDFLARDDQRVKKGMSIATVGNTGSLRGASLYFEVRVRGQHKDPRLYLERAS